MEAPIARLSQELLLAVKTNKDYQPLRKSLEGFSWKDLTTGLKSEPEKLAFWLNIYNAYIQILLQENPKLYHKRRRFYLRKLIKFAEGPLSFDWIEHRILRHSQFRYGFGYLPRLLPSRLEQRLRLKKVDPRIHFALNCGAKSCPPIAFYRPENISRQLDQATSTFLETEADYNKKSREVHLPQTFLWFIGDFGGYYGVIRFLKKYEAVPSDIQPKLRFKTYDWSLALKHYVNPEDLKNLPKQNDRII